MDTKKKPKKDNQADKEKPTIPPKSEDKEKNTSEDPYKEIKKGHVPV